MDINHVEAMGYQKYWLVKERIVRMRDGSVAVRGGVNINNVGQYYIGKLL